MDFSGTSTALMASIGSSATSVISGLSPIFVPLVGLLLAFYVLGSILEHIRSMRSENREEEEEFTDPDDDREHRMYDRDLKYGEEYADYRSMRRAGYYRTIEGDYYFGNGKNYPVEKQ